MIKIFLLVFIISSAEFRAQDSLSEQFGLAKGLFNKKKYFDAITEFKRLKFFDNKKEYEFQTNLMIGECYKAGGKFDEALRFFTIAEICAEDDDDYYLTKEFQIRTNILRGTTIQAHRILNKLEDDNRFKGKSSKILYWRGWTRIFEDDWQGAADVFKDTDSTLSAFCKSVGDSRYSVDFAKYSSLIIPGTGQIYTGEILSGILSLGWNILSGYFTVNAFIEDRVFDGIVIGNLLWLRFFTGNLQNAEKFAIRKNLEISNNALNYLQNEFNGLKP